MGGVVFNMQGAVTVTNSTLTGNTATGGTSASGAAYDGSGLGGAIFNLNGSVTVSGSTIDGNTAAQGGAGIDNLGYNSTLNRTATVTLLDSIVYGDTSQDVTSAAPAQTTAGANDSTDTLSVSGADVVGASDPATLGSGMTPRTPSLGRWRTTAAPACRRRSRVRAGRRSPRARRA